MLLWRVRYKPKLSDFQVRPSHDPVSEHPLVGYDLSATVQFLGFLAHVLSLFLNTTHVGRKNSNAFIIFQSFLEHVTYPD